ncbi:lanthionine synthetase C family protein [Kitasatospora sp. NPDC059795]|uniref:lanthionine synthetase C family protein n=1 Tax=Kitasatospora sp. NPDC059795 TaxID=3346949 RepID=UPI00365E26E8
MNTPTTPHLTAALRRRAASVADSITDALSAPWPVDFGDDFRPDSPRWRDQSLSKGAAGVAVLHGVRAQHGDGDMTAVHAWLTRATGDGLSAGDGAGLWFGAPAVAFALHSAAPGHYRRALSRLDTAVGDLVDTRLEVAAERMRAARRPSQYEFDLTRGLAGIGAHLLHRDPGSERMGRVLAYLVHLARPIPAADAAGPRAPGWWTADLPTGPQRDAAFADGHANFGMAHGITGPLALLSLALRQGVTVDGHREAIDTICWHLDTWQQSSPAGTWWPERLTLGELQAGRCRQEGPARPSWCYGTPGIARAQQLAAIALGDTTRQLAAEDALAQCLADPRQLASITDPALCHGWAGVLATAWHAAADAATPRITQHLDQVLRHLLDHTRNLPHQDHPGLIEGSAGIALTLHTVATGTAGSWPTCLLIC